MPHAGTASTRTTSLRHGGGDKRAQQLKQLKLFAPPSPPIDRDLHVAALTRILSDVHFGDRASRVERLAQLRPLLGGVSHLVLNGDTLDTRPGPNPAHTGACRAEVAEFFPREVAATTFLTGNHDADFSPHHALDLADGAAFVIHGDIFFENIVPWSMDVPLIERLLAAEFRRLPRELHHTLEHRLAAFRRVSAAIPQRHQSERRKLKYWARLLRDVAWPPTRVFHMFDAWRTAPARAARVAERYRPHAKFIISGHTHRPGIWRMPSGLIVINTGSYCLPFGGSAVDLTDDALTVRRIDFRNGEFRLGATLGEFPLAAR